MKTAGKLLALVLALVMLFSLAACCMLIMAALGFMIPEFRTGQEDTLS